MKSKLLVVLFLLIGISSVCFAQTQSCSGSWALTTNGNCTVSSNGALSGTSISRANPAPIDRLAIAAPLHPRHLQAFGVALGEAHFLTIGLNVECSHRIEREAANGRELMHRVGVGLARALAPSDLAPDLGGVQILTSAFNLVPQLAFSPRGRATRVVVAAQHGQSVVVG